MKNYLKLAAEFVREGWHAHLRNNESQLARMLRKRVLHTPCMIDTGVIITAPDRFEAGSGTALYHGVYILNGKGRFALGAHSHLGAGCYVNVQFGNLTIGEGTAIGPHTQIIVYSNHYAPASRIVDQRLTADVTIGSNVFIGANCTILPGSRIADNVIVGANTLVRGELHSDSIYAGTPCRLISSGWYSGNTKPKDSLDSSMTVLASPSAPSKIPSSHD